MRPWRPAEAASGAPLIDRPEDAPGGEGAEPLVVADRVRWGDVDFAGIVRYDAFARFYDLAEGSLLRAAGYPLRETIETLGIFLPRRVLHAEFHAPARLDDLLEVRAYVSHVGTTSVTLNFDIYHADGGPLCATSYFVLVCVGRDDRAKRPLPAEVVAALAPFRLTAEQARSRG